MKNILIVLLLVTTIAFAAVAVAQRKVLKDQATELIQTKARIAALEDELNQKSEAIAQVSLAEQKAAVLQKTVTETAAAAVEKSQQVEQLQQKLDAAKTNDMGSLIGTMLKDPKMKEMIKNQQKLYIGPIVTKSYGAFMQQMNLSPDQSAQLRELIENKMMVAANSGTSMLDSSLDASQRAEIAKQIKSDTEAYDQQIKEFLGDENYKAFQSYEKTVPDRLGVDQFGTAVAGTSPLSDAQQAQLIEAFSEERNNFKWSVDFNKQAPENGDYSALFSEAHINQFAQEQERLDQQCLARAQTILNEQQLKAYEEFRKTQREMQIAGMKIAAKMFGGGK